MFEQSILESSSHGNGRRGWATLASSGLQVLLLGSLILVPVLRPDALPLRFPTALTGPPQPFQSSARHRGSARPGSGARSNTTPSVFAEPRVIPTEIYTGPDLRQLSRDAGPSAAPDLGPGCPGCPQGITPGMSAVFHPAPVIPRPAAPRSIAVSSGVIEGYLVQQVQPVYPQIAKLAGVQGDVILQAVIGNDGTIQQLHAVSGHPWLIPPAMDAVRQWRYRPYRLNGRPVEVETQITVRFVLAGR
ncbi:MAG TPA: TonB family protein [Terriglobales bacterium]|nr:TonB family protein [Terriglobales bacterium]